MKDGRCAVKGGRWRRDGAVKGGGCAAEEATEQRLQLVRVRVSFRTRVKVRAKVRVWVS